MRNWYQLLDLQKQAAIEARSSLLREQHRLVATRREGEAFWVWDPENLLRFTFQGEQVWLRPDAPTNPLPAWWACLVRQQVAPQFLAWLDWEAQEELHAMWATCPTSAWMLPILHQCLLAEEAIRPGKAQERLRALSSVLGMSTVHVRVYQFCDRARAVDPTVLRQVFPVPVFTGTRDRGLFQFPEDVCVQA